MVHSIGVRVVETAPFNQQKSCDCRWHRMRMNRKEGREGSSPEGTTYNWWRLTSGVRMRLHAPVPWRFPGLEFFRSGGFEGIKRDAMVQFDGGGDFLEALGVLAGEAVNSNGADEPGG